MTRFARAGLLLAMTIAACDRNSPPGPTVSMAPPAGLSPTLSSIGAARPAGRTTGEHA